jgi:acyl transferase domain-containing protein/acyl-CoA synthetase (AMP-forming)/AMP-acid ligase II/NADPH:quinone reductase-like Zn-dependent oxidoreductase/thioesterase domain-containing protein/acyl carrier protein/SAM-dependent methyltransferase/short-subunit dehydrogenase
MSVNRQVSSTLADLAQERAQSHPNKTAFMRVNEDGTVSSLTYGELDCRASAVAAVLQNRYPVGSRVIVPADASLEFPVAFYGTLYAGMVAVPSGDLQASEEGLSFARSVVSDCAPVAILTDPNGVAARSLGPRVWSTSDIPAKMASEFRAPVGVDERALACLLYTSGSTSNPKGVMIRHANLMAQCAFQVALFGYSAESVHATWLSPAHGVGLVGGVCIPVFAGFPSVLLTPDAFLRRPGIWLETITRFRATHSGGPNFAYDLCVRRISDSERARYDLSSWSHAYNGGETVRPETLDRFARAFSSCGFRRSAFSVTYGLTEVTTRVSGSALGEAPRVIRTGDTHAAVGCGSPRHHRRIEIVDPEHATRRPPGAIGEIWVGGPDVAAGYWNRPDESDRVFGARLADTGEGPFLRTGDLGAIVDGELVLTGRCRDLIIVRGRNHYPDDLERTATGAAPALEAAACVAFSVEGESEERVVVVVEVADAAIAQTVAPAVRSAIARQHQLVAHAVVCVEPGRIPRTRGGKLRRQACRAEYLAGGLLPLNVETERMSPSQEPVAARWRSGTDWLLEVVAMVLDVPRDRIDASKPFVDLGVDSAAAVRLAAELERRIGWPVPVTALFTYPTVALLHEHLAELMSSEGAAPREERATQRKQSAIAIVGYSCRFPGGANDPHAFWRLLHDGKDAVVTVPPERWDSEAFFDPDPDAPNKTYSRWGGFLQGVRVDAFDPVFFGISAREAASMDPQQRLLLEVTWEAFESACIRPDGARAARTGVFVGASTSDYSALRHEYDIPMNAYAGTGASHAVASGRISYALKLQGPALTVNTACSSSLVALHLACQSLRDRESDLAVAGGVNLILTPDVGIGLSKARMLSPDGRCKAFDRSANGFVRGEGCGVVLLKRLEDALADGDEIRGIIRATAVNQDGRSNGLTAPNEAAQVALIREALGAAGLAASDVGYVEAHGTGTALGDPIEVSALAATIGQRPAETPFFLSSVKTNIGHLEAAAGIAGIIKVLLALEHSEIPPHLHLSEKNPLVDWSRVAATIPTRVTEWKRLSRPRIASVSSFGFSGTNAFALIEEPPARDKARQAAPDRPMFVAAMSAMSKPALRELASRYASHLGECTDDLGDVCFSISTGRALHSHRLAAVASSVEDLRDKLASFAAGNVGRGTHEGVSHAEPRLAFLFTGQGSQYVGMGRALYESHPAFRATLERCERAAAPRLGRSLIESIVAGEESVLQQTRVLQPALYALQVALVDLWRALGIAPDVVMGHSVGEFAAAYAAGVFDLEPGLELVIERGRLMQSLAPGGGMVSFAASEDDMRRAIREHRLELSVAACNGPTSTVISGPDGALDVLVAKLPSVKSKRLATSHAFHSELMDPIVDSFETAAHGVAFSAPRCRFISSVTGSLVGEKTLTPAYWRRQLREPVRFSAAVAALADLGCRAVVEIGPSADLLAMALACGREDDVFHGPSLRKGKNDWEQLLDTAAALFVIGIQPDWARFDRDLRTPDRREGADASANAGRRRVALPTYPFERQRHWWGDEARRAPAVNRPEAFASAVETAETDARGLLADLPTLVADGEPLRARARHFMRAALGGLAGGTATDISVHAIVAERGVLPRYRQLVARWAELLESAGEARWTGDRLTLLPHPSPSTARGRGAFAELLERCGPDLATVVVGATDARELLFPGGSHALVEAVYAELPALDRLGTLVGRAVGALVGGVPEGARLRVLEVGAGTGATTAHVLPHLAPQRAELVFTDISPLFLRRAAETFGDRSNITFRPLDLNAHPSTQGFAYGAFDLIVASNVLHATPDAGKALDHIRWLLASSGTLVVVENAGGPVFDATFGLLLEPHVDPGVRGHSPLMDAGGWSRVLASHGFDPITVLPSPQDAAAARLGVHVFLGRGPAALRPSKRATEGATIEPAAGPRVHPMLGARIAAPIVLFQDRVGLESHPWIGEHRVSGVAVVPGAAFVDMALRAAREAFASASACLENVVISRPLALPGDRESVIVQTLVDGEALKIYSSRDRTWHQHVGADVRTVVRAAAPHESLASLRSRVARPVERAVIYERFLRRGLAYGELFRGIHEAWVGDAEALAEIDLPEAHRAVAASHEVHPAVLDAAFQVVGLAHTSDGGDPFVPATLDRVRLARPVRGRCWCHAKVVDRTPDSVVANLIVFDAEGPALDIEGLQLRRVRADAFTVGARPQDAPSTHEVRWAPRPRDAVRPDRRSRTGRFVIFADRQGAAERLASHLASDPSVDGTVLVRLRTDAGVPADGELTVDPGRPEDFVRVLRQAGGPELRDCRGVLHLVSLDVAASSDPPLVPAIEESCGSALHVAQALVEIGASEMPPLWIVTCGAVRAGDGASPVAVAQAPVWGLGGVVAAEHPELGCARIDLDPNARDEALALAAGEFLSPTLENQIAFRKGQRLTPRLRVVEIDPLGGTDRGGRIEQSERGLLEALALRPSARRRPSRGQVEVKVVAAGMQFRDVLIALGLYPEAGTIGSEYAGVVVEVGPEVEGLKAGDEVFGLDSGCFATHVVVEARNVLPKPPSLSFEEAATMPCVFLTAWYALERLAELRPGQSVLVHAGAGGVGMAAIQLAHRAGATVLATAGSDEKRRLLRGLGVDHVFDSRSLSFRERVLEATGNRGVDVVVNSLSGDFIPASVDVLAPGGHFIELGKRDVWSRERVSERRPGCHYHLFALDHRRAAAPEEVTGALRALAARFEQRELRPLPVKTFAATDVEAAFRFMQRAQHIGKLCLAMDASWRVRADAAYLVTGGLRGIGLLVARRLVERGARHIALVGRSEPSADGRQAIEEMRDAGASVRVLLGDISRESDVQEVLGTVQADMGPLAGIVHAAGVLEDGSLTRQTLATLRATFGPKVFGTWHLHEHTQDVPLDFFLLLSSQAAVLSSPGQANHAAACAFEDAFAHFRVAQGLSATSVNCGPWGESGVLAGDTELQGRLRRAGFGLISDRDGVDGLERILGARKTQVMLGVVDWAMFRASHPERAAWRFFEEVMPRRITSSSGGTSTSAMPVLQAGATTDPDALRRIVTDVAGKVLGAAAGNVAGDRPLAEQGLDSLMSVELRNLLQSSLGTTVALPATLTSRYPTVNAISEFIAQQLSTGGDRRGTSLVEIRAGQGRPIVFVHSGIGSVDCYVQLAAAWTTGRPLFALQSRGLLPEAAPHDAVEPMAEHYMSLLGAAGVKAASLVAWSMGGVVAVHMATAAFRSGPTVDRVALVDAIAPAAITRPPTPWQVVAVFATQRRGLPLKSLPAEAPRDLAQDSYLAFAMDKLGALPSGRVDDATRQAFRVCEANWRAYLAYRPATLPPRMTLLVAADAWYARILGCTSDSLGWGDVPTADRLTVPGDHFELFSKAGIAALAAALDRTLKEGQP